MPDFNFDDIDFDLNNLRLEEDMRRRRGEYDSHYGPDSVAQQFGIPVDGNAVMKVTEGTPMTSKKNEKATQTVLDLYNQIARGEDQWNAS